MAAFAAQQRARRAAAQAREENDDGQD